jgi:hypothetical protein
MEDYEARGGDRESRGRVRVLAVCVLSGFVVPPVLMVGVFCQACFAFFRSLTVFGAAIHADEDHAPKPQREGRATRSSLRRALGGLVGALVQDVVERFGWISRVIRELVDGYHVDHRSRQIEISRVNCVEVKDVITFNVTHEEVVDNILVSRSHALQPKRVGFR